VIWECPSDTGVALSCRSSCSRNLILLGVSSVVVCVVSVVIVSEVSVVSVVVVIVSVAVASAAVAMDDAIELLNKTKERSIKREDDMNNNNNMNNMNNNNDDDDEEDAMNDIDHRHHVHHNDNADDKSDDNDLFGDTEDLYDNDKDYSNDGFELVGRKHAVHDPARSSYHSSSDLGKDAGVDFNFDEDNEDDAPVVRSSGKGRVDMDEEDDEHDRDLTRYEYNEEHEDSRYKAAEEAVVEGMNEDEAGLEELSIRLIL
jgi:hypothetical protein